MAVTQHPPIAQRAALASLTGLRGVLPWIVALLVGLTTFGLRATHLSRSFDVFIDEVTYLRIAHGVGTNLQFKLFDKTFYLRPPLFFFLEAAFLRLTHSSGTTLEQIYTLRYLNVLFASLSAGGLLLIARRLGGWKAGLIAAGLFALDPFVIKMNSLVLLDTSTLWWVLAGYGLLLWGMDDTPRPMTFRRRTAAGSSVATPAAGAAESEVQVLPPAARTTLPLWRALLAGLCFGLALLTKDLAF